MCKQTNFSCIRVDYKFCLNTGIGTADGERWRENRRFVLHKMRDLGMGRSQLELVIQAEANRLVEQIGAIFVFIAAAAPYLQYRKLH